MLRLKRVFARRSRQSLCRRGIEFPGRSRLSFVQRVGGLAFEHSIEARSFLDEQQANEWTEWSGSSRSKAEHIIVAAGQHLDVAELIEDELILGLPRQVCFDQQCANMPHCALLIKTAKPQRMEPVIGNCRFRV